MHIGIIGGGPGGINAARQALKNNLECTVFEQNSEIGGTWVYTDETELNQYGLPVHSSMYQGLITNLPKQTMEFPDFKYPSEGKSYLPYEQVLEYFKAYVKHFQLDKHIKLLHHVTHVEPIENDRWSLSVKNLQNNELKTYEFDAVIVSIGHYSTANYPEIPGAETFPGKIIHSHSYRKKEDFENQKVLVIGMGPSGLDIAFTLSDIADKVFISHHNKDLKLKLPEKILEKPDVKGVSGKKIIFLDGSQETIESIIYCTGFKYNFPFLSEKCGITVEKGVFVTPLYKHLINIEHPTMAFLGIVHQVPGIPAIDLQNRFIIASFTKTFLLPSKAEMKAENAHILEKILSSGKNKAYFHNLGKIKQQYFDSLANEAGIEPMPKVINRMVDDSVMFCFMNLKGFRNTIYQVIDDDNFEVKFRETI